jgi:hypothetical protein
MITRTGRRYYFLNPSPESITWSDIAFSLARVNRFAGHNGVGDTVYEHLANCAWLAHLLSMDRGIIEQCFTHDAHEAYVGDASSPLKKAMRLISPSTNSAYDAVDEIAARAVADKFGIQYPADPVVKKIDFIAYVLEMSRWQKFHISRSNTFTHPFSHDTRPDEVLAEKFIAEMGSVRGIEVDLLYQVYGADKEVERRNFLAQLEKKFLSM